jgi:hypothetical protein
MVVQNTWTAGTPDKEIRSEISFWEIAGNREKVTNLTWNLPHNEEIDSVHGNISSEKWFPERKMIKSIKENVIFGEINDQESSSNQDYRIYTRNIPKEYKKLKIDSDVKLLIISEIYLDCPYPFKYAKIYMFKEQESDFMAGTCRSLSIIDSQVMEKEGEIKLYRIRREIK